MYQECAQADNSGGNKDFNVQNVKNYFVTQSTILYTVAIIVLL